MVDLLKSADPEVLVIALISAGSSLMALPVAGVSLEDYKISEFIVDRAGHHR